MNARPQLDLFEKPAQLWLFDAPRPPQGAPCNTAATSAPALLCQGREAVVLDRQCAVTEKIVHGSICCMEIADHKRSHIRNPFRWRGEYWVCTGAGGRAGATAFDCYRVFDARDFQGVAKSYAEHSFQDAHLLGLGGYHAMSTMHGKRPVVLVGPPVAFVTEAKAAELQGADA